MATALWRAGLWPLPMPMGTSRWILLSRHSSGAVCALSSVLAPCRYTLTPPTPNFATPNGKALWSLLTQVLHAT